MYHFIRKLYKCQRCNSFLLISQNGGAAAARSRLPLAQPRQRRCSLSPGAGMRQLPHQLIRQRRRAGPGSLTTDLGRSLNNRRTALLPGRASVDTGSPAQQAVLSLHPRPAHAPGTLAAAS